MLAAARTGPVQRVIEESRVYCVVRVGSAQLSRVFSAIPTDEDQQHRLHVLEKVILGTPPIVGLVGRQDIDVEDIDIEDVVDLFVRGHRW